MTADRLAGRTIAATGEADGVDDFVRMLGRADAHALVWPTIGFEPTSTPDALARALDEMADFDWIVFTSPRAVHEVTSRLDRCPEGLRVGAVGASTDAVLRRAGWRSDVVGRGGARALIGDIASFGSLEGALVLFPASSLAADTVEREVDDRGGRVERVEAYRTVAIQPERARVLADLDRGVDVVTFASPSSVRSLSVALDSDWPDALGSCGIAAIGPTTGEALVDEGIGHRRVEIADPVGLDGLFQATARALPSADLEGPTLTREPLQAATLKDDAS